jgi:hypothetical protein
MEERLNIDNVEFFLLLTQAVREKWGEAKHIFVLYAFTHVYHY